MKCHHAYGLVDDLTRQVDFVWTEFLIDIAGHLGIDDPSPQATLPLGHECVGDWQHSRRNQRRSRQKNWSVVSPTVCKILIGSRHENNLPRCIKKAGNHQNSTDSDPWIYRSIDRFHGDQNQNCLGVPWEFCFEVKDLAHRPA